MKDKEKTPVNQDTDSNAIQLSNGKSIPKKGGYSTANFRGAYLYVKMINGALFVIQCPECGTYLHSASERDIISGIQIADCKDCEIVLTK